MFIENLRKSILEFNNSQVTIQPTFKTIFDTKHTENNTTSLIDMLIAEVAPEEKEQVVNVQTDPLEERINIVPKEEEENIQEEQNPIDKFFNPKEEKRQGGQYDLDKHKYRIGQIEYRKLISKNKKHVYTNPNGKTIYEDANELMDRLESQKYKKKWSRLTPVYKKDRVKDYLQKLVSGNELDREKQEIVYKHLCTMINTGLLTKKEDIEYNDSEGYIVNINKNHIDLA
jgi:hypothetical protein